MDWTMDHALRASPSCRRDPMSACLMRGRPARKQSTPLLRKPRAIQRTRDARDSGCHDHRDSPLLLC